MYIYKVYVYTNTKNGKKYVGATRHSLEDRAGYSGDYYRGSSAFWKAIKEDGWEFFEGKILEEGLTKKQASEKELSYMEKFDTTNPAKGYNQKKIGYSHFRKEDRKDIDKQISETLKRDRGCPEYRKLMSERMQRVWDDPERRKEMLEKRRGKPAGRKVIPVYCKETDTIYPSRAHAGRALEIHPSTLCTRFKNRSSIVYKSRKHKKTYHLSVVDNVHVKESELPENRNG